MIKILRRKSHKTQNSNFHSSSTAFKYRRPYRVRLVGENNPFGGLWAWHIISPNGSIVATTHYCFESRKVAVRSAKNFVKNAGFFFVYEGQKK